MLGLYTIVLVSFYPLLDAAKSSHTHKQDSNGVPLDNEVSDVLLHFDSIVTELENSTLTPRSLTPNDPPARTPTPSSQGQSSRELTTPDIVIQTTAKSTAGGGVTESGESESGIAREAVPKTVQPKFRIEDIKQQFLQSAQRVSAPQVNLHSPETPSSRDKVRSIIAQIQASSRENSPSPVPEGEGRESPVKQTRSRSSSISQRISMLTAQVSTENEVFERQEQPVVPSKRISELTHDFEAKKRTPDSKSRPRTAPPRRKRRSSSTSKDDAPRILSPPKSSSQVTRRTKAHLTGFPQPEKSDSAVSLIREKYTSREIEEAQSRIEPSKTEPSASIEKQAPTSVEESKDDNLRTSEDLKRCSEDLTSHEAKQTSDDVISEEVTSQEIPSEPEKEGEVINVTSQQVEQIGDDITLTSPLSPSHTSLGEPEGPSASRSTSQTSITSPAREVARKESTTSSEVLLSPSLGSPYRFRSVSDISHNTRRLISHRTESSVSTGSLGDSETIPPV